MLNAHGNNGYIRERDLRHVLKREIPEMSARNLSTIIGELKLVIDPTPIFPFRQYNILELMDNLNQISS